VILADTSLWVEHFRRGHRGLAAALERDEVGMHPIVLGELACGNLPRRVETVRALTQLRSFPSVTHAEALAFIGRHRLFGLGIGYADVQLLAGVVIDPDGLLWTLDRRLAALAERLGVAYRL
jgi:predicted nucleic acid-binding protein